MATPKYQSAEYQSADFECLVCASLPTEHTLGLTLLSQHHQLVRAALHWCWELVALWRLLNSNQLSEGVKTSYLKKE